MGGEIEFKAYAPEQGQLLPSYTAEAPDPSDPAFFVDEVVEGLDLWAFERCACPTRPRRWGSESHF